MNTMPETTYRAGAAQIVRSHISTADPWAVVENVLPDQGAVEVQHDAPLKEHPWHSHETDETLIFLTGSARFFHKGGAFDCAPGDVVALPAGVVHGSRAGADGCTYVIAFGRLGVPTDD